MTVLKRPTLFEPEDLSIRVRRGDASDEERRALEHALEASALLRTAHHVGLDFDEALRVRPGDDALVARATGRAMATNTRTPGRRSGRVLVVAATLAFASSAGAAGYWYSGAAPAKTPELPAGKPAATEPRAALGPRAAPADTQVNQVVPKAEPAAAAKPPADARPLPRGSGSAEDTPVTAATLFRDANAARRAGKFALAESLYTELQARYPGTDEASVTRVSLGRLLLAGGRAREADQQFKSYLGSGRKNLVEEALVGRAEALARLGERGEERSVWQVLLRNHPSSVYAARARQRLDELAPADARVRP